VGGRGFSHACLKDTSIDNLARKEKNKKEKLGSETTPYIY